ncbi:MAG: stage 0 sporulation family protein [Armatimonadota bacterium]|nr:stage 0 sporulation family protein [Armatimonadota bacterium]
MPRVVGVSFRRVGKVYYFDPGELDPREGDFVIAETSRGLEFGEVMIEARDVPEDEIVAPLKRVVRLATGQDLEREADNRESEKRAFDICQQKVTEHNLPMKLIDAERSFDGTQITFYFSAENRVDFRELVKGLATVLNVKVQLHQIGVRDEAKLLGGYGTCGRALCCATFLNNFEPVSMKMAKDQSLFLNPAKFSGICGKLMCCLKYEHEVYRDAKTRLPSIGATVQTPRGEGKVVDINVISETLTVELEDQVSFAIPARELDLSGCCRKHGCGCPMTEQGCHPLRHDATPEPEPEPVDKDDADL